MRKVLLLSTLHHAVLLLAIASRAGQSNSSSDCIIPTIVCSGLQWFKINEAGLLSGTVYDGTWGTGKVMDTLEWTATIPASLKPGAYLIRFELLALHQANTPQFYPELVYFDSSNVIQY